MTDEGQPPKWVAWTAPWVRRLPRGRYRAMNWLCRRPPAPFSLRWPRELGGFVTSCDLRDSIAREVCFTGRYEPAETALLNSILKPGMIFVDVGANWGYFTLLAAGKVGPSGRVLSLEPDPRLFRLLEANAKRNRLDQIQAVAVAASDREGEITLLGFDESGGNFGLSRVTTAEESVSASANSAALTFQVPTRTLDRLLTDHCVETVDLMKMDIEGAEGLALRGLASGLAARRIQRLLLEIHPRQLQELGTPVEDALAILPEAGYQAWSIRHDSEARRTAAYSRRLDPHRLLRKLDDGRVQASMLDDWPHWLWTAPGVSI